MSIGATTLTVVGITADPELRFTASGIAVAKFTVASTPRVWDRDKGEYRDEETLFLRCTAWRDLAQHIVESLTRGIRVVMTGQLKQSTWETPEGEKRSAFELDVDDIGPSLRWATTKVSRLSRSRADQAPPDDTWSTASPTRTAAPGTVRGSVPGFDDARPPF